MKIRPFFTFCAAIVAGVVFIVWCTTELVVQVIPEPEAKQSAPAKPTNMPISTTGSIVAATAQLTNATATPHRNPQEEIREILATQNDVPIVFYGKLEDQFGSPVSGAEIVGDTIINRGEGIKGKRFLATSDNKGFFTLDAGRGEKLGITPKKEGYALATTQTAFEYSHMRPGYFIPDTNNPVVIKMWKLQGEEPLINIDQRYKIPYTDKPICFDLIAGKIVPDGGDIKITVNRSPGIISSRNPQDWGLQVEVIDGGLIETSMGEARVTYWAPNSGYQPNCITSLSSSNNTWYGAVRTMFIVKSRGGQVYSKISFSFHINESTNDLMEISFRGVANTNGSRNWEGDPNTLKALGQ